MNNRLLWVIVAVVGIYLLLHYGGQSQNGVIRVAYDKIGQARDALGNIFSSPGINPGR